MPKTFRAAAAATLAMAAVALATGPAATAEDKKDAKVPDIKTIMTEGHKGTNAFLAKIGAEAKAGKWDEAQEHAKALDVFGAALGKNKPPKGDDKSWEKLAEQYHENTKAVLEAAGKKDAPGVQKALKAISGSCGGCHSAHKGK